MVLSVDSQGLSAAQPPDLTPLPPGAAVVQSVAEACLTFPLASAKEQPALAASHETAPVILHNVEICLAAIQADCRDAHYHSSISHQASTAEKLSWLRVAASRNHSKAQRALVDSLKGSSVDSDREEASLWERMIPSDLKSKKDCFAIAELHRENGTASQDVIANLYLLAAEDGLAEAQYAVGACYSKGEGFPNSSTLAVYWFQQAAEQGYLKAQSALGVCHAQGRGVPQDPKKAVEFYQRAADQNHAPALCNLGLCYEHGRGVSVDFRKAIELYGRAADQNHAPALCNLGLCYEQGRGVPKDSKKAVGFYQRAADQNHALSLCNLGLCYGEGRGVPVDFRKAIELYGRAADMGHAKAQSILGFCYEFGRQGVSKDQGRAIYWYQQGANNGDPAAQRNLGNLYMTGQGIVPDQRLAVHWISKAAEQDYIVAQTYLADCYGTGSGIHKDLQMAMHWLERASETIRSSGGTPDAIKQKIKMIRQKNGDEE